MSDVQEDIIFEETILNCLSTDKSRIKKFYQLLDSVKLPWDAKYTLIDIFPTIENYFNEKSDRINFINMNQLASFLCEMLGYPECSHLFKNIKTESRKKKIKICIQNAIGFIEVRNKISDFELIKLGNDLSVDKSKVCGGNHIYSDLIYENKVNKTQSKSKKRILLRRLQKG